MSFGRTPRDAPINILASHHKVDCSRRTTVKDLLSHEEQFSFSPQMRPASQPPPPPQSPHVSVVTGRQPTPRRPPTPQQQQRRLATPQQQQQPELLAAETSSSASRGGNEKARTEEKDAEAWRGEINRHIGELKTLLSQAKQLLRKDGGGGDGASDVFDELPRQRLRGNEAIAHRARLIRKSITQMSSRGSEDGDCPSASSHQPRAPRSAPRAASFRRHIVPRSRDTDGSLSSRRASRPVNSVEARRPASAPSMPPQTALVVTPPPQQTPRPSSRPPSRPPSAPASRPQSAAAAARCDSDTKAADVAQLEQQLYVGPRVARAAWNRNAVHATTP